MSLQQKAPHGLPHLSAARNEHRTWIKGRAATLLAHYWRDDDDLSLVAAIGKDWADVLEGIPQEYIQRACIQYQRDDPKRRPTPGAIYGIAKAMMPRPAIVERQEPERKPATPEQAAAILAQAGYQVAKRFPE